MQARKSGESFYLIDYQSKVKHWSPGTGVETVYQVPPGVADLYDEPYDGLPGYYPGFNMASVDGPQVGFTTDGVTQVIWVGFNDADVDTTVHAGLPGLILGVGFGDLYLAHNSGGSWWPPMNITNSPDRDERYPSIAASNEPGVAHIVYQTTATATAGNSVLGDRDEKPLDFHYIMYYEYMTGLADVSDKPRGPATPVLSCYPSPSRSMVEFTISNSSASRASISIFDVAGRRVAEIERRRNAGETSLAWDGRYMDGTPAASGVYFATLKVDGIHQCVQRFVLAR
jgi:hypothetical protein